MFAIRLTNAKNPFYLFHFSKQYLFYILRHQLKIETKQLQLFP